MPPIAYLVLGFLVVFVILQLTKRSARCPHCDERVKPQASVCRHCGRDI